jgi:molecular chaperone GrpE
MSETREPEELRGAGMEPAGGEDELDNLKSELDEANKKGQEYFQALQRAQADFANFRRRTEQQRQEQMIGAKADVILGVLPVVDDFLRALDMMPADDQSTDWGQGIQLIARKLVSALDQQGVKKIDALGKQFDPWQEEAVDYVPTTEHDEGEVMEVVRDGYKIGDKVIRPAQVRVARAIPK